MAPDVGRCHGGMHVHFVEGGLDLSREDAIEQAGCGLVCVYWVSQELIRTGGLSKSM